MPRSDLSEPLPWSRPDTLAAIGWFGLAWVARAALLARVEGVLDHDQAVVGLMALDIADGRRWPIFFDGQRYMGAVEAYTAALLVRLLGHSPTTVAIAPTFYCALFAAGQYAAWRLWSGRAAGHLAALFTLICSPMLALWTVIPRGGYSEVLAWAVATLAAYRALTRPGRPRLGMLAQVGWGFLFALGYFLNPLSLVFYATIALDWALGRHGADLRRDRLGSRRWPDSRAAPLLWSAIGIAAVVLVAVGCHVDDDGTDGTRRFVFAMGVLPGPVGMAVGIGIVLVTIGYGAWWTGLARRAFDLLASHPGFGLGMGLGLSPFLLYNLRVKLGLAPFERSLPIWVRAPWTIGPNLRDGLSALGPLLGGQSRGANTPYLCLALFRVPDEVWPPLGRLLALATPAVVGLVALLLVAACRRERAGWRDLVRLEGRGPTSPTVLASIGLAACVGLYLLQATSADGSSIRYLLPAWVFLPGLVGSGLLAWPRPARSAAIGLLLAVWTAGQINLRAEMAGPNRERALADRLQADGVRAIVASSPLVQVVAELTQGRVGGVETHPTWPRLGDRYRDRFVPGAPIVCVIDLDREGPNATAEDPNPRVRDLGARSPGIARPVARVEHYEIWRIDLGLAEFLEEPGPPLPGGRPSGIVSK